MLAFLALGLVGLQALYVGLLARVLFDSDQRKARRRLAWFGFNRAVLLAAGMLLVGLLCGVPLIREWWLQDFRLPDEIGPPSYLAVAGLGLMLAAFIHFTSSLVYNAAVTTFGGFMEKRSTDQPAGAHACTTTR